MGSGGQGGGIYCDMVITWNYWYGEADNDKDWKASSGFSRRILGLGDVEKGMPDRYPFLIALEKVDSPSCNETVPISRAKQWNCIWKLLTDASSRGVYILRVVDIYHPKHTAGIDSLCDFAFILDCA